MSEASRPQILNSFDGPAQVHDYTQPSYVYRAILAPLAPAHRGLWGRMDRIDDSTRGVETLIRNVPKAQQSPHIPRMPRSRTNRFAVKAARAHEHKNYRFPHQ